MISRTFKPLNQCNTSTTKTSLSENKFGNPAKILNQRKTELRNHCKTWTIVYYDLPCRLIWLNLLPSATELRQGFTVICDSVHGGGVYPSMHWGIHPLWTDTPLGRHPLWADTLLGRHPQGRHYPGRHPLPDGHCSGRYATYWNAFLF